MTWQETAAQLRYPSSRLTYPLAPSMRFFKNFPWLVVNYPLLRPTTHYMVTNMGLNISLPLIRIDSSLGVCLAFLSVPDLGEALVLASLKQKDQRFASLSRTPHFIKITCTDRTYPPKIKWKRIYLLDTIHIPTQ